MYSARCDPPEATEARPTAEAELRGGAPGEPRLQAKKQYSKVTRKHTVRYFQCIILTPASDYAKQEVARPRRFYMYVKRV